MRRNQRRMVAVALTLLLSGSCGSTCGGGEVGGADRAVRSALDAFALAAQPVSDAIVDGCVQAERRIEAEAQAHEITALEAREQLTPLRARCDAARALLDRIRKAHDAASTRVEAGDVQAAEAELSRLRREWEQLSTWGRP